MICACAECSEEAEPLGSFCGACADNGCDGKSECFAEEPPGARRESWFVSEFESEESEWDY